MEPSIWGALKDKDFWKGMGTNLMNLPETTSKTLSRFGQIPSEADGIAEKMFPDSARDASTKNAFRHALGTGMIAQEMGANKGGLQGDIASNAAKGMGYLWELFGANNYINSAPYREDTKHDLNANAIGAKVSKETADQAALIQRLQQLANESKVQSPPGVFQSSPGYLTRTVR